MGEPLDDNGRKRLAHQILQTMLFEQGVATGKGDMWQPQEQDLALLKVCMNKTQGLREELIELWSFRLWDWGLHGVFGS